MTFVPQTPYPIPGSGMDDPRLSRIVLVLVIIFGILPVLVFGSSFLMMSGGTSGLFCLFPMFIIIVFFVIFISVSREARMRQRMMESERDWSQEGAPPYPREDDGPWGEDRMDPYDQGWGSTDPTKSHASGTSVLGKCPKCGNIIYKGDRQCMRCGWKVKERRLRPF